tara:strand:- start:24 stop:608 length:585 start_codon:yes stop_codon:yes gene_type:complete
MKLLIENFRQYLDADEDTLTGLSFEEMSRALGSSMGGAKLALTDSPLQDRTYEQGSRMKPNGLWYAKGNSWMEFVTEIMIMAEYAKYVYAIGFDKSKILSITSGRQAERVTYMFKDHELSRKANVSIVDWDRITKIGKAGVEFIPYERGYFSADYTMAWYLGIDVPSGCIWDTSILTTKQVVAELKEDGWEVYR